MGIEEDLWKEVYSEWRVIFANLRRQLPSKEHLMFNDEGKLVPSNRPMEESILSDKVEKSNRLFYYMMQAGLIEVPNMRITENGANKIIEVGVRTPMPIGTGGKQTVARKDQG